jgi:hypothetical protein
MTEAREIINFYGRTPTIQSLFQPALAVGLIMTPIHCASRYLPVFKPVWSPDESAILVHLVSQPTHIQMHQLDRRRTMWRPLAVLKLRGLRSLSSWTSSVKNRYSGSESYTLKPGKRHSRQTPISACR